MKKIHATFAGALIAVAALAVSNLAVAADDVSGTWQLTVETQAGTGSPTVTFEQKGETLTGHYKGQLGEAPLTGTLKGDQIAWSVKVSAQGQDLTIDYTGKVEGSTMSGKIKLGDFGDGTFTAKKQ